MPSKFSYSHASALDALRGHFRPEFLNRIDEVIIFDRLTDTDLIREFWILNLQDDRLEIHRQPEGPAYREQIIIPADGTASPLAFPDVTVALAEILPPR